MGRALLIFLAATAAAQAISVSSYSGVTVTVANTGVYEIVVDSPRWTFSGSVGSTVTNLSVQSGADNAGGAYSEISFNFFSGAARQAAIRIYSGSRAVLFTMSLPSGGPNTVSFPSLSGYPQGLNHIGYCGLFGYPSFAGSSTESPWIAFDQAFDTAILSPASHFMVATTGVSSGQLASGISTQITSLPAGFTQQTLLVIENGINRAFDTWGKLLTGVTGKARLANDADLTLNKLGYWTDAGSTYYYSTEPGLNYPETLSAVKQDFARQGFALGYLQLDSWFYPKGQAASWLDMQDGIYQYFAASPPFASSLPGFRAALGIPLVTHSRWIDPASPYRQQYAMSGNVSIDPLYWGAVAQYLSASGAVAFEQDWLFDKATTDYNLTDEDAFLGNMSAAMSQQNIGIQYCSGSARHFLQSSLYGNVTSIRASMDRFNRPHWTNFLYASRLVSAVGTWPFTDVFLTSETSNLLLATLSAGPLGVGDRIGSIDAQNLARSVRPDGVIVKPDVPIAPTDASFWSDSLNAQAPMIAATYSDFGSLRAWYLFLYAQGTNTQTAFRLADAGVTAPVFLYDYVQRTGSVVQPGDLLSENVPDYAYMIAAPIGASGMAFLGDAGHFVSLGKKRITQLSDDGALHVSVAFAAHEAVRTVFGYSPVPVTASAADGGIGRVTYDLHTRLFTIEVQPGADGEARLTITSAPHRAACNPTAARGCR